MHTNLDPIILKHLDMCRLMETVRCALRYEAIRRFTPEQFTKLHRAALLGENFDAIMDMAVVDMHTDKFTDKATK